MFRVIFLVFLTKVLVVTVIMEVVKVGIMGDMGWGHLQVPSFLTRTYRDRFSV
jgi:hypothetical protein